MTLLCSAAARTAEESDTDDGRKPGPEEAPVLIRPRKRVRDFRCRWPQAQQQQGVQQQWLIDNPPEMDSRSSSDSSPRSTCGVAGTEIT